MKKNLYLLLLTLITLSISCKKDETISAYKPFKSNWILGKWSLTKGVQLSELGGDTVFIVENNIKSLYYFGGYINKSKFIVDISFLDNGGYIYNEENEFESGTINSNWKWLNSSQNKTHLEFSIAFNGDFTNSIARAYKIIELSENKLIIEDIRGYFRFEYKRVSSINNEGDFEQIKLISPQLIIGNWKLKTYQESITNYCEIWFQNDTLYEQYNYEQQPSFGIYSNYISIKENGDYLATSESNGVTYKFPEYWFWTDSNEPHKMIMINPLLSVGVHDWEITTLNNNTLVIEYHNSNSDAIYNYSRIN